MTTTNSTTEAGVTDQEVRTALRTHHLVATVGAMVDMRRTLEQFAQSRQPCAQGGEAGEWKAESLRLAKKLGEAQLLLDKLSRSEQQGPSLYMAADNARRTFVAAEQAFMRHLDRTATNAPKAGSLVGDAERGAAEFAAYLIDHCEGNIVSEESLQAWLVEHIAATSAKNNS